jgi:hypothetical protein
MRPSRGIGIVVLALVGVSGCAGVPQRTWTSSPMEAPAVSTPPVQTGWRGWWSRWRKPAAPASVSVDAPVSDLPIETSGRIGPEREIWPDRSQSLLLRLLPPFGLRSRSEISGPVFGFNATTPSPTMTAAEANLAIAGHARQRKADDFVLPVRMWGGPDDPTSTPPATQLARAADDQQSPTSVLPAPIPLPGEFAERYSARQSEAKLDPATRNVSAEDVGLPPLVDQVAEGESGPALDSPSATLVTTAQVPPPPPVRPSPRATQTPETPKSTPPPPPVAETPPPSTEPAKPEAVAPSAPKEVTPEPAAPEPAKTEPVKPAEEAAPTPPAEKTATAPAPTEPAAPAPVLPPSAQAPLSYIATSQTVATPPVSPRATEESTSHRWWFMKWMRPHQNERSHQHQESVYPSAQSPILPPVLVPTSYFTISGARPSGPTPTAQQAFVLPTPQSPPTPTSHVKKPCVVLTRLHNRLEQFRQWKHDHICKHIQSFKDALTGKNRCQACGEEGGGPIPSAQVLPAPQGRPAFPAPQAWSLPRFGLMAEPGHVAERE